MCSVYVAYTVYWLSGDNGIDIIAIAGGWFSVCNSYVVELVPKLEWYRVSPDVILILVLYEGAWTI